MFHFGCQRIKTIYRNTFIFQNVLNVLQSVYTQVLLLQTRIHSAADVFVCV